MCVIAAATMLACGTDDADDAPQNNVEVASNATVCTVRAAGDPWWVTTYPVQRGRFHATFQATPYANNIDAVIGLSSGGASTWTKLAAIVRFSPAGVIDVRKGGAYAADVSLPYSANTTYFVRVDLDVSKHTYSVAVTTDLYWRSFTTLANNYPFRTEQAGVTSLDAAAVYLEPSRPGSLQLCDWTVVADDTTPDGCVTSTAGGTFANANFPSSGTANIVHFSATPTADAMDGVVGYTAGPADAYNDFAASIRFYTNGQIEARDGDTYRASSPIHYTAGTTYTFYFAIDYPTHTYSVFVLPVGDTYDQAAAVAQNFKFRPQQASVTQTNNLSTVVASPGGQVKVCQLGANATLRNVRTATQQLVGPLSGGRYVLSDANGSQIIDSAGVTQATTPIRLQRITYDEAGNIYNARYSETDYMTTTIQSFTSAMAPRWTKTYDIPGAPRVLGSYGNGVIGFVSSDGTMLVNLRASDGAELARFDLRAYQPTAIAIGPGRFAFAWRSGNDGVVEMHAVDGAKVWERRWTDDFGVNQVAIDPYGSLVFGGSFGPDGVDFGSGRYEFQGSGYIALNGFIVALESNGATRYAQRLYAGGPDFLDTTGDVTAYGYTQWPDMPFMQLFTFDRSGNPRNYIGNLNLNDDGDGAFEHTILTTDGYVVANVVDILHPSASVPRWPLTVTLIP